MNNGKPTQLELDLKGGSAPTQEIGLTPREVAMTISLCETARDLMWGKLLTDSVPAEHVYRIKSVVHEADRLIEKLKGLFGPEEETHGH